MAGMPLASRLSVLQEICSRSTSSKHSDFGTSSKAACEASRVVQQATSADRITAVSMAPGALAPLTRPLGPPALMYGPPNPTTAP